MNGGFSERKPHAYLQNYYNFTLSKIVQNNPTLLNQMPQLTSNAGTGEFVAFHSGRTMVAVNRCGFIARG